MGKKRTYREFKQGIFKPKNLNKVLNKDPIVYRSGLELSVMMALDKYDVVKKWGSEFDVIPYYNPVKGGPARYFIDFTLVVETQGKFQVWLVEVKPQKQIEAPTINKNKKQSTVIYEQAMYAVNKAKWDAAEKYASTKGWFFTTMSEDNIETFLSMFKTKDK